MRHLLITGFPGFLATELLGRLAGRDLEVTLLVEERFAERAGEILRTIGREAPSSHARFELTVGDITRPSLGLEEDIAARMRSECDTLVHLAAVYDLAVGQEVAARVNLRGTEQVNSFAREMGSIERYGYVSTVVVAGRREGLVREEELEHEAGFFNHYEETKYLAEVSVRRLQQEGLPVIVFRPGVVVGRSTDGWTTKYDGPYLMLRMLERLPAPFRGVGVGREDVPFPMVPVDFVAGAMVALLERPEALGKTFHLTDPDPLSSAELFARLATALRGRGPSWHLPAWLTRLGAALGTFRLLGIPRESVPYVYHPCRFDCSETLAALEGTGPLCPPAASYIETLVHYYQSHPDPGGPGTP